MSVCKAANLVINTVRVFNSVSAKNSN